MSNSANDNPVLNPNYQYKAVKAVMRGSVFEITLNRPERLNTFNAEMQKDFTALQMQIERNPEIRCITLFAEGERAFGAGADLSWFEQDWKMPEFRVHYRWIHDFFDVLERVEIPVIAAVFGSHVHGGPSRDRTFLCRFVQSAGAPARGAVARMVLLVQPSRLASIFTRSPGLQDPLVVQVMAWVPYQLTASAGEVMVTVGVSVFTKTKLAAVV